MDNNLNLTLAALIVLILELGYGLFLLDEDQKETLTTACGEMKLRIAENPSLFDPNSPEFGQLVFYCSNVDVELP